MMLGGGALVAAAFRPAPAAPEPAHTFDLRPSTAAVGATGSPTAGVGTAPTGGRGGQPRPQAPVGDPVRLEIPSLKVVAPVRRERLAAGGDLVVPGDPHSVGSWHGAPDTAASAGTLVLAGHVDSEGDLGALHPLSAVAPGATVELVDAAGRVESWRVDALEVRRKEDLPDLPASGPRRLALVTCGGPVVRTGHGGGYRDNVIAWASPGR